VQKLLGDRVGHDIFMYSISLQPEQDTPEPTSVDRPLGHCIAHFPEII
jgi:hypothetical protein